MPARYVFRMEPARPGMVTLLALTMGVFLVTLNVTVVTVALPGHPALAARARRRSSSG